MMLELHVREATKADYGALCELFDEVDALHRDHLPDIFQEPDGPVRPRDYFWGLIRDDGVGLFVAEVGGRIVGFVHAVIRDEPALPIFFPQRHAVVEGIAVKSEFRNRGIGRRLMGAVQDWAISNAATSIELNVYEFNKAAMAFYQKLGYGTLSRKMRKRLGS